jgi:hypothetical protein
MIFLLLLAPVSYIASYLELPLLWPDESRHEERGFERDDSGFNAGPTFFWERTLFYLVLVFCKTLRDSFERPRLFSGRRYIIS